MHSIFVHLRDARRDDISEYFDTRAGKGLREHWYYPNRTDPVFSIRFPHGDSDFRDEENRRAVVEALGAEPALTVQLDAGGKHPGHPELRRFLIDLFEHHPGVALDDLSPHVWTLEDLRADRHVLGFAFADHESWRKLHTVHPHAQKPRGLTGGGRT